MPQVGCCRLDRYLQLNLSSIPLFKNKKFMLDEMTRKMLLNLSYLKTHSMGFFARNLK